MPPQVLYRSVERIFRGVFFTLAVTELFAVCRSNERRFLSVLTYIQWLLALLANIVRGSACWLAVVSAPLGHRGQCSLHARKQNVDDWQ